MVCRALPGEVAWRRAVAQQADHEPAEGGSVAADRAGAQARHLGRPIAGAPRLDGGQLGPQRRDESPVGVRHRLRGPGDPAVAAPRLPAEEPKQGRCQELRIVMNQAGTPAMTGVTSDYVIDPGFGFRRIVPGRK
jgi:hypothetical protein